MSAPFRLVANVSLLFSELPFPERFAAARQAGFELVECWWPFGARAEPDRDEVDAFLRTIADAGVRLTGMNLFAGDMAAGERGVLSHPDRAEEFRTALSTAARVAERTGLRGSNALWGRRLPGEDPVRQDAVARERLADAALRLGELGVTVLVEALARDPNGDYPIRSAEDAAREVMRVRDSGADAVGILLDTYHLASNGDDLLADVDDWNALIAHVQLADAPGRGAPGTGGLDLASLLERLAQTGYDGLVAAEYLPAGDTSAELGWIDRLPRLLER